jgi:hypothetical protein
LTSEGQAFASPGDCTRYTAHGGLLRVNPYPAGKRACDELPRGIFEVDNFRLYTAWTCTWAAADVGASEFDLLWISCRDEGGDWGGGHPPGVVGLVGFQCIDFP